jgi:hypothetical protein
MIRLMMGCVGVAMLFVVLAGVKFGSFGMVSGVPVEKVSSPVQEWNRDAEEIKAWRVAVAKGAPVFKDQSCGSSDWCKDLPTVAGGAIRHAQHGMVLVSDDVAEFGRWYGVVSAPPMRLDLFPGVQYVYEATGAKLDKLESGALVVKVAIHEKRSGCALPACDPNPQTGLSNYERTWDRTPEYLTVDAAFFAGRLGTGKEG